MATHSRFLVWRIPQTEEPGELQSMGSQELDTSQQLSHTTIHGERIFLIQLINTPFPHIFLLFCVRTFKFYSLSKCYLYNIVILTLVSTFLHEDPQTLLATFFSFLIPHISGTAQYLISLACFTQHNAFKVHLCCLKWQNFLPSHG